MAFYECEKLESAKLTAGIEEIGKYIFHKCAETLTVEAPADSVAAKYANDNGYTLK